MDWLTGGFLSSEVFVGYQKEYDLALLVFDWYYIQEAVEASS